MLHGVRIVLCATLAAYALLALGQTPRVAVSSPLTSIDPHYHNLSPNFSLALQIYNRLVEMDQHQRPIPGLALSWKPDAPDTWEFKLRDAKFHNGEAFSADDVLFTLDRVPKVPNSPSSFAVYTKPVVAAEAVDPHTVKSGKAAIGTGPFRERRRLQIGCIAVGAGRQELTGRHGRTIQAVGQMWQRIGVQTEVDPLPWTSYVSQANKQSFPAFLFGWGTPMAETSDSLIAQTATWDPAKGWGASNRGRYGDPALDKPAGVTPQLVMAGLVPAIRARPVVRSWLGQARP